MTDSSRAGSRRMVIVAVAAAVLIGGGYAFVRTQFPQYYADTSVYSVAYEKPAGWKEEPPGPFTLFVFREPTGKGTLRASINEVQAKMNPTPELDTNGIADHYVDLTEANMPDWNAERLKDIESGTEPFSVIKRTRKDRTVYTAFCAKGNTTIVVSLTGGGNQVMKLDDLLPTFRKLVASFRLTPKHVDLDE